MIALVQRRPIMAAIAAVLLLFLVASCFPIVSETKQGVVVRFGKPARILNEYRSGQHIGGRGAGISWRIPFAERIEWIDKRVLDVDMDRQQVLSTDQLRLEVDAFARYRITNPLRAFIAAGSSGGGTEAGVSRALQPILGSELRNELGKRPFAALLSPERQGVMENVRRGLDRVARQYGAEIIDVRIKRADLPDGTPLDSAYERMRNAREQEARSIRADAAKNAQIIRATADAQAAKTYAASFGKDPAFYDFYRAMQSYETTFIGDGSERPSPTTVILSPENDYLKEFTGRSR